MPDETPAVDPAPSGAVGPVIEPQPTEPLPVAGVGDEPAVVGHTVGAGAVPDRDISSLATVAEAQAHSQVEDAYRDAEAREQEINRAPESIASHTVSLLQSDTVTRILPKVGDEGVRLEQVHTNL